MTQNLPLPPPGTISLAAFREALGLYPSLVEKVYRSKLKNDDKKVTEALKRDRWRFEELPAAVAAAAASEGAGGAGPAPASKTDKSKTKQTKKNGSSGAQGSGGGGGLTKDDVERLVQWKM
ncbi:hypothetical protein AYO20_07780 [Fonsecaea nubica]|uniref:Uncharacterized protein n=1 Tax=Fonsecaea nubica TaxID=856822 RepID=A0A178CUL3_9EURO|nr:hypothetical protein AYO20_07780 [Fonsecaea nubica]OAL32823.1 hypothetical protein AYO20_07780 [Fonsecaea nubica]